MTPSLTIFTAYLLFILKFKELKSISESYYRLKHKIWFTLALWGFAIPVMIEANTLLMFLAGSCICFVGALPDYKQKLEGIRHYIGATGGIVFGMASIGFDFKMWWLVGLYAGFLAITMLTVYFRKGTSSPSLSHTLIIEAVAFYVIIFAI